MRNIFLLSISLFVLQGCSFNSDPIKSAIKEDKFVRKIIKDKDNYEIQILYTEVSKNNLDQTEFKDFQFQLNDEKYLTRQPSTH